MGYLKKDIKLGEGNISEYGGVGVEMGVYMITFHFIHAWNSQRIDFKIGDLITSSWQETYFKCKDTEEESQVIGKVYTQIIKFYDRVMNATDDIL